MSRKGPRGPSWTRRRIEAAINACEAMLAGAEGEGDWPKDVRREDLEAASERLKTMLYGAAERGKTEWKGQPTVDEWAEQTDAIAYPPEKENDKNEPI